MTRPFEVAMYDARQLTHRDAAELWNFRLSALEDEPNAFAEAEEELRASPVDVTEDRLRASRDDHFVPGAFVDGRLVGTVGFFRNEGVKTRHKGRLKSV